MKVGDYVRTEHGEIGKYVDAELYYVLGQNEKQKYIVALFDNSYFPCIVLKDFITKSGSLIDLLETGDIIHYQNEYIDFISPVIVYDDGSIASNLYDSDGCIYLDNKIDENNIKSIVTKEQFERMEYKV